MVGAGGAIGSMARYGVSVAVARTAGNPVPYATAIVNVAGCAIAGVLLGAIASGRLPLTADQRSFAFAGVLGGLTTFSGVGIDTLALVQQGRGFTAAVNVVVQITLGLAVLAAAYTLTRH
jgi:CrcB protein